MKKLILCLLALSCSLSAKTLNVGLDEDLYQYQTIRDAAFDAEPGDSIIVAGGVYSGGERIENLKGSDDSPIYIIAKPNDSVVYRGGSQAIHFVQLENVVISGFVFEGQTANGVNIDDGGTFDTPAKNVVITNCSWLGMNASDNNDELKLSGVEYFAVKDCYFKDGSGGGSLVDMVGCHNGYFQDNVFENGGSNSIQAKGGSSKIRIERNLFVNGGLRAINIGGSTGLPFFRPQGADYEAANINVWANVFIGAQAPVAYVGAINCNVVNNTLVKPDKWAIRILQESVDGFQPCGDNAFVNNIVYISDNSSVYTLNIGNNTAPETFFFANNLWYNYEDDNWTGPNLPVEESNGIINEAPMFIDIQSDDFALSEGSPAIGAGLYNPQKIRTPIRDFNNKLFKTPPSIGALESDIVGVVEETESDIIIFPNPVESQLRVKISERVVLRKISIYNLNGEKVFSNDALDYTGGVYALETNGILTSGVYLLVLRTSVGLYSRFVCVAR